MPNGPTANNGIRKSHVPSYAKATITTWFFRNRVHLLTPEEGESVSAHLDLILMVITVLIPLVLATTRWRLWGRTD